MPPRHVAVTCGFRARVAAAALSRRACEFPRGPGLGPRSAFGFVRAEEPPRSRARRVERERRGHGLATEGGGVDVVAPRQHPARVARAADLGAPGVPGDGRRRHHLAAHDDVLVRDRARALLRGPQLVVAIGDLEGEGAAGERPGAGGAGEGAEPQRDRDGLPRHGVVDHGRHDDVLGAAGAVGLGELGCGRSGGLGGGRRPSPDRATGCARSARPAAGVSLAVAALVVARCGGSVSPSRNRLSVSSTSEATTPSTNTRRRQ